MRTLILLTSAILAGCSVSTPQKIASHTCNSSSYVKISIDKPSKNDLRIQNSDIIRNLAKRCIIQDLGSKASLKISFDSYAKTVTQEKTLTSNTQVNANIKMRALLSNGGKKSSLSANSASTINSKQILGFGERAIVTNADRLQLLNSVVKTIALQTSDALGGDASQKSAPKEKPKKDVNSQNDDKNEIKAQKKEEEAKDSRDKGEDVSNSAENEEPNAPIDGDTF